MASSGNSSGSPRIQNSGSEGDLQQAAAIDQRKRKRMESNRESARRSRMRKQKHLDDLLAQVAQFKKENGEISSRVKAATQHYGAVEAENSVLRAQKLELSQRLYSLNEILTYISTSSASAAAWGCMVEAEEFQHLGFAHDNTFLHNPIPAAAEIFDY